MANSNKMTELKKAAKSLLDTLYKAAKSTGDIKVAVIPFATDVNVGITNAGATGSTGPTGSLRRPGTAPCEQLQLYFFGFCLTGGVWVQRLSSQVWKPGQPCDLERLRLDRVQDYDVLDTLPSTTPTRFPAHQASNCPTALLPLSDILSNWVTSI